MRFHFRMLFRHYPPASGPKNSWGPFWQPTAHLPQAVDGRKIKPRGTPVHPRPPISRLEPPRRRAPRFGRNKSNPQRAPPASPTLKSGVRGIGTGSGAHAQGFELFVHLPSHPLFVVGVVAVIGTLSDHTISAQLDKLLSTQLQGLGFLPTTFQATASAVPFHHFDARGAALMKSLHADGYWGQIRSPNFRSGAPAPPRRSPSRC